ncbi:GntR family transcriptional regulator [Streptomyces sp. SID1034]|uniref:GntR family transcriptional regulator n=1 Tax=Streptomyces sp. SID1034 TaxID=2690248 RepID=UPI00136C9C42|nr:GntR family transcriptional regulator [Streptomyces sp. SID1034]
MSRTHVTAAVRKASTAWLGDTAHVLLRQIARGDRPPGHRLPQPADLARELGVSEIVLRNALDALTRLRVLKRGRALQHTVAPEKDWSVPLPVPRGKAMPIARRLREAVRAGVYDSSGEVPTARVLASRYAATTAEAQAALRELAAEGLVTLPPHRSPLVRKAEDRTPPSTGDPS